MSAAEKRLHTIRSLLTHVRERLGLDIGFVLWDGSTVPADLSPCALALVIADEGAVAALDPAPQDRHLAQCRGHGADCAAQRHDLRSIGAAATRADEARAQGTGQDIGT